MKRLVLFISIFTFTGLIIFSISCKKNKNTSQPIDTGIYGWAVGYTLDGYGTIIYTNNGGKTWVRQGNAQTIPNTSFADVCVIDKKNVWAVGGNIDGYATILKTSDGGETWIRLGSAQSIPDVELEGISVINNNIAWAAGDEGTILKTTDGGTNWTQQNKGKLSNVPFQMVYATDDNNVWAVGIGDTLAVILHTSNGGDTWTRQGLDSLHTGNIPNALIDVHAINHNVAWTVGAGQALYTLDGGETWTNKSTPLGPLHNNGVCIINENIVWVASDYKNICKLTDLDSAWILQSSPAGLPSAEYMGITAFDEYTAWIVSVNIEEPGGYILYTNDGGNTWVEQTNPVNISLRRISFAGALR